MKYRTIVADPPWPYGGFATMPGNAKKWGHVTKREAMPYAGMTLDAIGRLPIRDLTERDAFVFLWTTNRYLPAAFTVLHAWGSKYRQTVVWHKTGNPSPFGGAIAPNHAEYLLVTAIGDPSATGRLKSSVVAAPKPYRHSHKPEVFLDLIQSVAPGPYLELFARDQRLGWDTWGNEALCHVDLEAKEA